VLYLLLMAILMMYAVRRDFKLQLAGIFGSFAALIGYAIFSTAVVVVFVQYPGYKLITAFTQLKSLPFDFVAFFFVYFYGLKTRRDAMTVLYSIMAIVVLVNVVSGLDAFDILHIQSIRQGEDTDRVQGIIGEANQYGAYIAWFLPALVAMTITAGKRWRAFWLCGLIASFAVLLMTVSRGAIVALHVPRRAADAEGGGVGAGRFSRRARGGHCPRCDHQVRVDHFRATAHAVRRY
jgi:hypothetical protein